MPGAASAIDSLPSCKGKSVAKGLALIWKGNHHSINTPNILELFTVSLLGGSVFENNSVPIKIDKYIKLGFKYRGWSLPRKGTQSVLI